MSIESLCSTHEATVYSLTTTTDAALHPVESLGSAVKRVKCRFVPMSRKEQSLYEQDDLVQVYRVLFPSDPSLTLEKVLVWNSKVWRVIEYQNNSEMSWMWSAVVKHEPQVELSAP